MKIAWTILIITALTDFIITAGTALTTAMVATGSAEIPNWASIILGIVGGVVAAARTIQQQLKASAETTAAVTGVLPPRV